MSSNSSISSNKETQHDSIALNNQVISENLSKFNDKLIRIKNFINEEQDDEFENFYNRISLYFSNIVTELKLACIENLKTFQLKEIELKKKLEEFKEQLENSNQLIQIQKNEIQNFKTQIKISNEFENKNKNNLDLLKDQLVKNEKDVIELVNENILLKIELKEKYFKERKMQKEILDLRKINLNHQVNLGRSTSHSDSINPKSTKQNNKENLNDAEINEDNLHKKSIENLKIRSPFVKTKENSSKNKIIENPNDNLSKSNNRITKRTEHNLSPNNSNHKKTSPYARLSTVKNDTPIEKKSICNINLLKITNDLKSRNLNSTHSIVENETNNSEILLKETSLTIQSNFEDKNSKGKNKQEISKVKNIFTQKNNKDNLKEIKLNKDFQSQIAPEVDKLKNIKNIFENYNNTKLINSKFFNYFSPKNHEFKQSNTNANGNNLMKSSKILFKEDDKDKLKDNNNKNVCSNKIDNISHNVASCNKTFQYNSIEINPVETESDINERLNTDGNYFINNHKNKVDNFIMRKSSNSPNVFCEESSGNNSKAPVNPNIISNYCNKSMNKSTMNKSINLKEFNNNVLDKEIKTISRESVRINDGKESDFNKIKFFSNKLKINQNDCDNNENYLRKNNFNNFNLTPNSKVNNTSLFEYEINTKIENITKERNKSQIENFSNVTVNSLSSFNNSVLSNASNMNDPNPSFTFNVAKDNKIGDEFKTNQMVKTNFVKEIEGVDNVGNNKTIYRDGNFNNNTYLKTSSIRDKFKNNFKNFNTGGILNNVNNLNNLSQLKNLNNLKK